MSYTPPAPTTIVLDFTVEAGGAPGAAVNLEFDTVAAHVRQVSAGASMCLGAPRLLRTPVARTKGRDDSRFGTPVVQRVALYIFPASINPSFEVGQPEYVSWRQFISGAGAIREPMLGMGTLRVRLLGGYNPPPGSIVALTWPGTPYAAPPPSAVGLEFGALGQGRLFSITAGTQTAFGAHSVVNAYNEPRTLYPFGSRMTQWGDFTTSQTGVFQVLPVGLLHAAYGQPALYNSDQHLVVFNEDARYTEFGTAYVWIPPKQFVVGGNLDATQYGTARIEFVIRYVEQRTPHAGPMIGQQQIADKNKRVYPPWAVFTQYGTALVGRHVELLAQGSDFAQIPNTHDVRYDNVAFCEGFTTLDRWGFPWVSRSPRVLNNVQRNESLEFGDTLVELGRRYVLHDGYVWELEGMKWGTYTHIFNVNRTIPPPGLNSFRMVPYHLIENAARALQPLGIDLTEFKTDTFIADAIRYLLMQGDDSFRASNFGNMIHNTAYRTFLTGRDSLEMGRPSDVMSNLQTIKQHSGSTEIIGTAFVADRVRTVVQNPALSASHRAGEPWISNVEQFALPPGIAPPGTGAPILLGPFIRTLTPFWQIGTRHGDARVWNKTPQLYPPGRPYTEFGLHWASFLNRPLGPDGISPPALANQSIQFRTRKATPLGWLSFGNNPWGANVRNALPDPPSIRTLVAEGFAPPPVGEFIGRPWVRYNTVRPEGINSLEFGEADTTAQGAYVRTYYPETEWGNNQVAYWRHPVYPEMLPEENLDNTKYGNLRMDPYTIWARTDTPAQAQRNNPGEIFHLLDSKANPGHAGSRWPWWGHARVTNQYRVIYPYHITGGSNYREMNGRTKFGDHDVVGKKRQITPEGVLSMRFAFPVLIPHTKKVFGIGWRSQSFGEQRVDKEYDRFWPNGLNSLTYGPVRAENLNRPVYPSGFAATQWGNNNPMVHYPRRFSIGDYDATVYGLTWLSHRIRHVEPAGEVMTQTDWTVFNGRMRVTVKHRPAVQGIGSLRVGNHHISNAQQFVRPYMIPPPCIPCNRAGVSHA